MNKKTFILDLNNITSFVFGDANERTNDTEITEIYSPEEGFTETGDGLIVPQTISSNLILSNRTIREVKSSNSDKFQIKYDMVKMFITLLNDENFDPNNLTIGQQLIFNTMLSYGLIKEVEV